MSRRRYISPFGFILTSLEVATGSRTAVLGSWGWAAGFWARLRRPSVRTPAGSREEVRHPAFWQCPYYSLTPHAIPVLPRPRGMCTVRVTRTARNLILPSRGLVQTTASHGVEIWACESSFRHKLARRNANFAANFRFGVTHHPLKVSYIHSSGSDSQ